jgi:uncharacterized protein (TIGR02996 family)
MATKQKDAFQRRLAVCNTPAEVRDTLSVYADWLDDEGRHKEAQSSRWAAGLPDGRVWMTPAQTARFVRFLLKQFWPKVRFKVRTRSYNLGSSIDVTIPRGVGVPALASVEGVVRKCQHGDFNGQTDSYYYTPCEYEGVPFSGVDYVFVSVAD